MSEFIVPIGNLPSIASLADVQRGQGVENSAGQQSIPFADFLKSAISDLGMATEQSNEATLNLAVGGSDDLHSAGLASVKAGTAISFTSNLVSSAIRSYNDIIKMQI